MIQQTYIFVFALTGAVCLLGLVGVRSLEHPDVRRSLAALLGLSGGWSLLTALQVLVPTHEFVGVIHTLALIVGLATILAWLAFASAYAGHQYHRRRSLQVSAVAAFLSIVAVKVTNPIHGLYFGRSVAAEPFVHTTFEYLGPHWFVTGLSYAAAAVGFLWLFDSFARNGEGTASGLGSLPTRLSALVVVTAVPIVPYVLASSTEWLLHINYEPLGVAVFAFGVLFYARAEFTRHSSPAQPTLADSLSDGGLVLDESGIVIDHNEQATEIIDRPAIPRTPVAAIDPELAALSTGERRRLTYGERTYEVERRPVSDSLIAAEIITLKDVTRATRLEQLTGIHREIGEALVNVTEPWDFVRDVPERFAAIDAYDLVWLYPDPESHRGAGSRESPVSSGCSPLFDGEAAPATGIVAGEFPDYPEWTVEEAAPDEPVLAAAASGEPRRVELEAPGAQWSRRLADRGVTESLAVPMEVSDQSCVLGIYTTDQTGFDAAERRLIEEICRRIPEAIERIETHREALQYKEAITHAGTAILITDVDGTIQYVNPAFERLTGYSESEAVGETPSILSSGEMSEAHYRQLWETILDGEVFEERIVNKTKDGDRYIARQTISPVTDDDGEPVAFVAIQFELTDKILREQRLSVLNRVLRHNLRTAVNVIDGHASLLENRIDERLSLGQLPEEISESLDAIRNHASDLTDKSETAREIERVLAGDRSGRISVPVGTLVEAAESTAASVGGNVTVTVDEDVSDCQIDAELTEVVEELVENAFVHSDSGTVDVRVSLSREGTDLILAVEDDGPGMSDQELVFVEEGGEDPLRHGSGLDLWKVNWLTISLGGSITATTGDGGTTIRVTVPLRGRAESADPPREFVASR